MMIDVNFIEFYIKKRYNIKIEEYFNVNKSVASKWSINYLKELPITDDSILKIRNFLRFSPNKFARKLGINEEDFQRKFNQIKKPLHLKSLYFNRILTLRDYRPELDSFYKYFNLGGKIDKWKEIELKRNMCICTCSF